MDIVVAFVLGLLFVCVFPVWVLLDGEFRGGSLSGNIAVGIFFGLFGLGGTWDGEVFRLRLLFFRRLSLFLPSRTRRPGAEPGKRTSQPAEEGRPGGPQWAQWMERAKEVWVSSSHFFGPGKRFLNRFWRSLRLQRASCDIVLGTGDPAQTGRISGMILAVRSLLGPRVRIGIDPRFLLRTFEVRGSLVFWLNFTKLIAAVVNLGVALGGMAVRDFFLGFSDRLRRKIGRCVFRVAR